MTTTAIVATLVEGPIVLGIRRKRAKLSLTLPESWTTGGLAIDFSTTANGGFTYISKWHFMGVAATDMQVEYNLISSSVGTGNKANALLASGCKVVAHQGAIKTGDAQVATPFGVCANSENHSTKTCYLEVEGW